MIGIQDIFSIIFVSAGIIAIFIGSIGVVRLPDFYTRTHAVSMSDSLGILFVITGLIIHEGFTLNSLKLFFIVLFVMLSNPIGIHALARAGYRRGVWPLFNPAGSGTQAGAGGSGQAGAAGDKEKSAGLRTWEDEGGAVRPERSGASGGMRDAGSGGRHDDDAADKNPGNKPDGGPQP